MTDSYQSSSGREPSLRQPDAAGQDVRLGGQAAILSALDLLNHQDQTIRQRAAYQLAEMGDERVIDSLIEWLTDENLYYVQRKRAAEALGRLKARKAVPRLIEILQGSPRVSSEQLEIRGACALALGEIDDPLALDVLFKALREQPDSVRRFIFEALKKCSDALSRVPALIEMLNHEKIRERQIAAEALLAIGDARAVEPLIARLERDPPGDNLPLQGIVLRALGRLADARAVEPLIAMLDDIGTRERIVTTLGEIGDQRALEALIAKLADPESSVRYAAAKAVGRLGDAATVDRLLTQLDQLEGDQLVATIDALGHSGDSRAAEPLMRFLSHPMTVVKRMAGEALGLLGDERAIEPLMAFLDDDDDNLRYSAVLALNRFSGTRPVDGLLRALEDEIWSVAWAAATVLRNRDDPRVVPALIRALGSPTSSTASTAAKSLIYIGDERAVDGLIEVLNTEEWGNNKRGIHENAFRALDKIGTPKALDALERWQRAHPTEGSEHSSGDGM